MPLVAIGAQKKEILFHLVRFTDFYIRNSFKSMYIQKKDLQWFMVDYGRLQKFTMVYSRLRIIGTGGPHFRRFQSTRIHNTKIFGPMLQYWLDHKKSLFLFFKKSCFFLFLSNFKAFNNSYKQILKLNHFHLNLKCLDCVTQPWSTFLLILSVRADFSSCGFYFFHKSAGSGDP